MRTITNTDYRDGTTVHCGAGRKRGTRLAAFIAAVVLILFIGSVTALAEGELFQPKVGYSAWGSSSNVITGDFNNDGRPDLAVAINGEDSDFNTISMVRLLMGCGDGTFVIGGSSKVSDRYDNTIVTAIDLAEDGWLDLAAIGEGNKVYPMVSLWNNSFFTWDGISVGRYPSAIVAGDFDRDGKSDLAAANRGSDNVSILIRDNGEMLGFRGAVNYSVGSEPSAMVADDFNNDGILDLAVTNSCNSYISILTGVGDGTFNAAVNYDVGIGPCAIAAGDFNDDGRPDLTVVNLDVPGAAHAGNVSILLGNEEGAFDAAVNYDVGIGPCAIAVGDFNDDGILDLAVVNSDNRSSSVSILSGNGDGTFTGLAESIGFLPMSDGRPKGIVAEDFNGDGLPDLAVISEYRVYIILHCIEEPGNADLSDLTVSPGSISGFSKDTVTYAVYGSGSPASLEITATAYSSSSSLTIGGQPAGSGSPCEVSLDNGANLIPIVVTASDGQTQRAYILSVNGTIDDTELGDLTTDIGTLDFDPSVVTYNLGSVANSESGIDITAAPHDPKALVLLNGIPIQEGESRTINLNYGVNDIDIMVVAQNAATKTYTISITRGMPSISWDAGSLQATDIGAAWLTLTWPAAFCDAGISGYNIYEGGSLLSKVADSVRSFNAAGLTQGTAYNFSVRAVDTAGSLSSPLTLSVSTSPGLEITTAALAGATVAQTYNAALEGCGGNAPYTWSAAGLPAGLTLGSADGTITGAAAAAGTSMVNVTLTDSNGLSTSRGFVLNVFYPAGTGKYTITPVNGPEITVGATEQGITTLTVNNGVTGFKYFEVNVATTESHDGNEAVVFVQMRGGVQIAMNATRADFDRISNAIAAFNVRPGDVIKVYVVDDLTNDAGSNPSLLQ